MTASIAVPAKANPLRGCRRQHDRSLGRAIGAEPPGGGEHAERLGAVCRGYTRTITEWPLMREWARAALAEPEEVEELDAEF